MISVEWQELYMAYKNYTPTIPQILFWGIFVVDPAWHGVLWSNGPV